MRFRFLFFVAIMCTSCANTTTVFLVDEDFSVPKRPRDVMIYLGSPPVRSRPFAILSTVRLGTSGVWAVEALKEEAAELGADAVVNVSIDYSLDIFPTLHVKGIAVQYGE